MNGNISLVFSGIEQQKLVCVYVYIYIYTCVCVYVSIYICMCMYIYTDVCIYICIYMYIYIYVCIYKPTNYGCIVGYRSDGILYIFTYMYVYICIYIYVYPYDIPLHITPLRRFPFGSFHHFRIDVVVNFQKIPSSWC